MKFVIVGANGQLGKVLQDRYPKARAVDRDELDITDAAAVQAFDWTGYDVILNAAAYTNVDGAQTPEGRQAAWNVNATAVANLAAAAVAHDLASAECVTARLPHTRGDRNAHRLSKRPRQRHRAAADYRHNEERQPAEPRIEEP